MLTKTQRLLCLGCYPDEHVHFIDPCVELLQEDHAIFGILDYGIANGVLSKRHTSLQARRGFRKISAAWE